ncbi:MAG TPA: hypothetical protein VMX54_16490 [Vicinamibacteria bacterium]|nr:hypothetical protein [Vicinamibacteria bacterium]
MRTGAAAVVGALLAGAGCHTHSAPPDVPAVLTHPSEESRAELQRVVSRALNRETVTLADDALTADGTLIVERTARRDAQGRPLQGLETRDRPEHFRLVRSGWRCVLLHENSGQRYTLKSATCATR